MPNTAQQDAAAVVADPVPIRPQFFNFDALAVRQVGTPDRPWFVARDVCAALGLFDTSSLRELDDDEKGQDTILTLGGPQQMLTINESGLYALIFRSRKPQAKLFRRWVTNEVLPSIRRTGGYRAAMGLLLPAGPRPPAISLEAVQAAFGAGPTSYTAALRMLRERGHVPGQTFARRVRMLTENGLLRKRPDGMWEVLSPAAKEVAS